jgi:hypothetical protein
MKHSIFGVLLVSAVALLLGGCPRQAVVYNVENAPVVSNKSASMDDVRKAIIRAGASLGWNITDESPDTLVGILHLRTHMAKVEIPYSATSYSIVYKDSDNLRYDGEKIHSNYNGWIQNLDRAIKSQLSTL